MRTLPAGFIAPCLPSPADDRQPAHSWIDSREPSPQTSLIAGGTVVVMMPIVLSQTSNPDRFTARHWMFVPIDRATLRGWISLSGVALINFPGQRFDFVRDIVTLDINEDLRRAIGNAPYKPQPGFFFATLAIEQWVPFATVNARGTVMGIIPVNTGTASDGSAADAFALDPSRGAMLLVDVAVKDQQSEIFRLGYQLSLYGSLVEEPILEARPTKPRQPSRRKRRA